MRLRWEAFAVRLRTPCRFAPGGPIGYRGADCPGTVKRDHLWANALCARTQLAETVSSRVIRLALSERLR